MYVTECDGKMIMRLWLCENLEGEILVIWKALFGSSMDYLQSGENPQWVQQLSILHAVLPWLNYRMYLI